MVNGLLSILYNVVVGVKVVFSLASGGLSIIVIFAVIYRTFVVCYFTTVGLIDTCSTIAFYDEILQEIDSSPKRRTNTALDIWCFTLFLLVFPEIAIITSDSIVNNILFIVAASLNTIIPLITMIQFCLCCAAVQSSHHRLQADLIQSAPRTSSFVLRRLRVRQLDIADRVRDISDAFGIRLLLYTLMIQFILLEKIDYLVSHIATHTCFNDCAMVMVSCCGYFVTLWYFSYCPFKAACQHQEALATLMDLETKDMDVSAMQEMTLLAEELSSRRTEFSAAGCFYVGFYIFYAVIGIIFSYVMIIGPLAYNKHKHLWPNE